ncbi:MAG: AhpC/TSA family protein [Bacteroidetes bacterium]|nr:AhpC/TSA family protein [Bacteroidota bacterium]HET6243155.1 peroxiredoxin-like family protein [Bacteroidia bacterium]
MKQFKITFIALTVFSSLSFIYMNQDNPSGLKKGEKAPAFIAKDHAGNSIDLYSILQKGPVVLMFYRGEWCGYCTREMSEFQDSLHYITEKGAYVIAITPETNNNISKTIEKTKASFSIIHDEESKIMTSYKTSFVVDSATVEKYKKWNVDLEEANGNKDHILPVPATYVIGKDGIIKYVFFDKDYSKRATVKDIINAL